MTHQLTSDFFSDFLKIFNLTKPLSYSPSNIDWNTIVQLCGQFGAFIIFLFDLGTSYNNLSKKGVRVPPHYDSAPVLIK